MGNKYVLLVNRVPHNGVPARCQYWIGDFKNEKFIPDNLIPQNLEVINRLLSPSVVETPEGDCSCNCHNT
jgi:beta-fructofuranosidase